jgi:hypothetical protein
MSHIQGQTHPEGMTEHLDYLRIQVDQQGALSQIGVVTHHAVAGLNLPQEVTVYRYTPGPGERDLAAVLTATRRTALQGLLTALAAAATAADTPADPAPPLRNPAVP